MTRRTCALVLLALGLGACAGEDPTTPAADAGTPVVDAGMTVTEDAGVVDLQIGTGERELTLLSMNATLPFTLGAQSSGDPIGGFHVFGGMRTRGLNPERLQTHFTIRDRGTGAVLSDLERTVPRLRSAGDGAYEVFSIRLILTDCCVAAGADLEMEVTATDSAGQSASSTLDVVGAAICPAVGGADACL